MFECSQMANVILAFKKPCFSVENVQNQIHKVHIYTILILKLTSYNFAN